MSPKLTGHFSEGPKQTGVVYIKVRQSVIDEHFRQLILGLPKFLWLPDCACICKYTLNANQEHNYR